MTGAHCAMCSEPVDDREVVFLAWDSNAERWRRDLDDRPDLEAFKFHPACAELAIQETRPC